MERDHYSLTIASSIPFGSIFETKATRLYTFFKGVLSSSNSLVNISNDILNRMILCWPSFLQKILMIYRSFLIQILNLFLILKLILILLFFLFFILFFQGQIFQDTDTINNFYFYIFMVSFIKDNMNKLFGSQGSFVKNSNILLEVEYPRNMPSTTFASNFPIVSLSLLKINHQNPKTCK